jgi:selenide,water dikinase
MGLGMNIRYGHPKQANDTHGLRINPGGGCLAKLPGVQLDQILQNSFDTAFGSGDRAHPMMEPEDCAVINHKDGILLATVDMAPLVVSNYVLGGRIAALHAMSDIFACGGIPRWALVELVVDAEQSTEETEQIMTGILQSCDSEGANVIGGHTMLGMESLIGLTVLGVPRSNVVLRKKGGSLGDHLFLSKPLGVGLIMRAAGLEAIDESTLEEAITQMQCSNSPASAAAISAHVLACTDVSGFGLLGHLVEMLGTGSGARLYLSSIPIIEGIKRLNPLIYEAGCMSENLRYVSRYRQLSPSQITTMQMALLLDPQTNGGLLVAAQKNASEILQANGFSWIGFITDTDTIEIFP